MGNNRIGMMKTHDLKTWPEFFEKVATEDKTFEMRLNDRGYAVGDVLKLREFDPSSGAYSGRWIEKEVSYVLDGGKDGFLGLRPGWVVMSIRTNLATSRNMTKEKQT